MTINITWTPRERDVVLQTAVFLYRHGRRNMSLPTHNESWRHAMFVLPVDRRRNFTSASNLGKIYELYMALLVDASKVDMRSAMPGHKEIEFPENMIIADRITVDMLTAFGTTLDTAVHVPAPKKATPQDQIDFLMKEVERLSRQVMDLTHAFEVHKHGPLDYVGMVLTEAGKELSRPKLEIVKGRADSGEYSHRSSGTLHHLPTWNGPLHENTARVIEEEPEGEDEPEGDGIGDDPGAMYDPENYSDTDDDSKDKVVPAKDIPPEHRPRPPIAIVTSERETPTEDRPLPSQTQEDTKNFWSVESAEPEHVQRRKLEAIGLDPAKFGVSTHDAENEQPAPKLPEPSYVAPTDTGPVLYFYGCPARLRPSLGQFLSKSPIRIRTVHLDDGGKTPTGDVACIVINQEWAERPSGRVKLIERNVTKPRHVEGGWTSILEAVRAALQDHYGLTFVA